MISQRHVNLSTQACRSLPQFQIFESCHSYISCMPKERDRAFQRRKDVGEALHLAIVIASAWVRYRHAVS